MSGTFLTGGLPPGAYSGIAVSANAQLYVCNGYAHIPNSPIASIGAVQIDATGFPTLSPSAMASSGAAPMQLLWLAFADPKTMVLCFENDNVGAGAWQVPISSNTSACSVAKQYHRLPYVLPGETLIAQWPSMDYFALNGPSAIQPFSGGTPTNGFYGNLMTAGAAASSEPFAGPNLYAYTVSLSDGVTAESALVWPPQWCWSPAAMYIDPPRAHPAAVYNLYMSSGSSAFVWVGACSSGSCLVPQVAALGTLQAPTSGSRSLLAPAAWNLQSTTAGAITSWDGTPPPTSSTLNGLGASLWFAPAQYTAAAAPATTVQKLLPAIPVSTSGGDGVCVFDLTPTSWDTNGQLQLVFSHRWPFAGADARILQAVYDSPTETWSLAYYDDTAAQPRATVTGIPTAAALPLGQLTRVCLYVHQSDDASTYYVTLFEQQPSGGAAAPNTLGIPSGQWSDATKWLAIPAPNNPIIGTGGKWSPAEGLALCPSPAYLLTSGGDTYTVANYTTMTATQAACQASNNGLRGLAFPPGSITGAHNAGIGDGWQGECDTNMGGLCTRTPSNGTAYGDPQTCCVYKSSMYKAILAGVGGNATTAAELAGCFASECDSLTTAYRPKAPCGSSQCLTLFSIAGNFNDVSNVTQNTTCRSCVDPKTGADPCCAAQPPGTTDCGSGGGGGGNTPSPSSRTLGYVALALGLLVLIMFMVYKQQQRRT